MPKIRIKIVKIGHFADEFDEQKILDLSSSIFTVNRDIESFPLRGNSDLDGWLFSDAVLDDSVPPCADADLLIAITNIPLELNYYSRRLGPNRIVITLFEVQSYLKMHYIPVENFIIRVLYAFSLTYLRFGNQLPQMGQARRFTHDETRGCLFDMNGLKQDIYRSCDKPIICFECEHALIHDGVSLEKIAVVKTELKSVKKSLFLWALNFIEQNPGWSIAISVLWTLVSGITGSLVATWLYH